MVRTEDNDRCSTFNKGTVVCGISLNRCCDAAEFLQYRRLERRYCTEFDELSTGYISSGHLSARSFGESRDMVGLTQDRMVVLAEHQHPDTGSSGSPMVDRGSPSENKPGTASAGAALHAGVVESRGLFRGIVRDVIPRTQ
jgi:hypothetical protein